MGRRPSDDAWQRGTRGRKHAANDRSHPPILPEQTAFDPYADDPDDGDSVVLPAITLPSARAIRPGNSLTGHRIPAAPAPQYDDELPSDDDILNLRATSMPGVPMDRSLARRAPANADTALAPRAAPAAQALDVVLVPGRKSGRPTTKRGLPAPIHGALSTLVGQRLLLAILVLIVVGTGIFANTTGALQSAAQWTTGAWETLAGSAPVGPQPGPDILSYDHYVKKYGFDTPRSTLAIPSDERKRLVFMLPYALQATAYYNARYHQSMEPQMILWWTHAEGIKGRINYSNCANNPPRSGYSYFSNIQNCPHASFWQLGYGNQFSVIYILKNAFKDMHGDPNDPQLVQKVGQWVLDYDRSQGTVPKCGGYSCTFPAMTIDQIMSGINTRTGVETADNWWASVLSRDPAINCYMIAHALTFFNHEATKNWVGNYYYEPYWQAESNRLGDILKAWPSLRKDAKV